MEALLAEGQVAAEPQSGDVPDNKLLLTHAEVAKPSMSPLNIVCASSGAAKVSLLAFGDFLLAELAVQDPTHPAPLACSILHVSPNPTSGILLNPGVLSFCGQGLNSHDTQGTFSLKATSLAHAQAELIGEFRYLCLVIQHSNTGEIVVPTQLSSTPDMH